MDNESYSLNQEGEMELGDVFCSVASTVVVVDTGLNCTFLMRFCPVVC